MTKVFLKQGIRNPITMKAAAAFLLSLFPIACSGSRPHILLIVVDDLGFGDLGFRNGGLMKTPTIDSLAAGGLVLDDYYVHEVCSPARAAIMTGRYSFHNGVPDKIQSEHPSGLFLSETLLPQLLSKAGYRTAAVGKWHLGFYKTEFTPTFRGFESFYGYYVGAQDYYTHRAGVRGMEFWFDFRDEPRPRCGKGCSRVATENLGKYSTHLFTSRSVNIIEKHNTSEPLFLYLAFQAMHNPSEVPKAYEEVYKDVFPDSRRRRYGGMLTCLDEGIKNVTMALERAGMINETLIILTTDNGGQTDPSGWIGARNTPLRGGKHSIWQGGVRGTSFITGWGIQHSGIFKGMMHQVDWVPTLCGLVGVEPPSNVDGINLWKAISKAQPEPRKWIALGNATDCPKQKCGFGAKFEGGLKIVHNYPGVPDYYYDGGVDLTTKNRPNDHCQSKFCLFNISADPFEKEDISSKYPDLVDELIPRLQAIENTYIERKTEHRCGPPVPGYDKSVGRTFQPWCDQQSLQFI